MVSRIEFDLHVADAYEHLYDLVYLRAHPLVDHLAILPSQPHKKRARELHRILLDVVTELDPGPQAPPSSNEWRRHRLMVLRYVRGLGPQMVADQLIISLRHYYRVHKAAVEAIAGILWDRYIVHPSASEASPQAAEEDTPLRQLELLRLEAARLAQADRYARVGDVVQGVLPLFQEMLRRYGLDVRLEIPETLPGVSTDRNLLRQVLLGTLGYLIERAEQATLQVAAQLEEAAVRLSLRLKPPETARPTQPAEVEEHLSALAEMATLAGAQILPVYAGQPIAGAGQSIVGFDLRLPIAERTVLVVDDNADVRELFRGYLSPHRYRVVTAQQAEEVLDKACQLQPYAITLDLMMPAQDGWELLQVLLNRPETRHIPVIVCSVLKQKELALSLGATAFLEKPVSEQALLAALEALEEL
jgi:CheY-like chemotaxis protein